MNAIKEAKDNIGDYKLKTADDYVVPEDQRVNAEIKLMQLLQLLDQVSELWITQQKTHNLFWPDENSIEQCCAAHIVQGCQQYCSTLLHLIAG